MEKQLTFVFHKALSDTDNSGLHLSRAIKNINRTVWKIVYIIY